MNFGDAAIREINIECFLWRNFVICSTSFGNPDSKRNDNTEPSSKKSVPSSKTWRKKNLQLRPSSDSLGQFVFVLLVPSLPPLVMVNPFQIATLLKSHARAQPKASRFVACRKS